MADAKRVTNKDKVVEFLRGKERVHLKEIWEGTGINKNSIMGLINRDILKGNTSFDRLGDGYYKLKEESPVETPEPESEGEDK